MTWIFFGWMFFRVLAVDYVVSSDPATTSTFEGGTGQPPQSLDGGTGQPPQALDGGTGQPPSRL